MIFDTTMNLSLWDAIKFSIVVILNTLIWLTVTFLTKPSNEHILISFYEKVRPGGPGWRQIAKKSSIPENKYKNDSRIPVGLLCMSLSCISILCILFSIGHAIYGNYLYSVILFIIAFITGRLIFKYWGRLFK